MVTIEKALQVVVRSAAWEWMRNEYLPAGPVCPGCGTAITGARALLAFRDCGQVYCAGCGKRFRATFGTPIHETSWQPEEYLQCLILHLAGKSPSAIGAQLGKSGHAVRDMLERIRLRHDPPRSRMSSPGMQAYSMGI
jgi:transposase-like protein